MRKRTTKSRTIPCLSVSQPFAELILRGDKIIENRSRMARQFGGSPLPTTVLIHATARAARFAPWMRERWNLAGDLPTGRIVGAVDVVACRSVEELATMARRSDAQGVMARALLKNEHVTGPFCWFLANPRRFPRPVVWSGAQHVQHVPLDVVGDDNAAALASTN